MSTPQGNPDDQALSLSEVLEDEFESLTGHRPDYENLPDQDESEDERNERRLAAIFKAIHEHPEKRSALCLSGGGIRSATFCLGVLQGLARCDLLGKFNYLSTVSGGGYIGSWFTAWIKREPEGIQGVIKALRDRPTSKINPEPKQISHLRSYSNYLSPKIGAFSVDTWTLVAIYLRNLVLNWLVFIPLLLAVLTIPRLYVSALLYTPPWRALSYALMIIGMCLGSAALAYIASHRPSLRRIRKRPEGPVPDPASVPKDPQQPRDPVPSQSSDPENDARNFLRWCLIPLIFSVLFLSIGRAWYLNFKPPRFGYLKSYLLFGATLHVLAWVFYARHFRLRNWKLALRELFIVLPTGLLGGAFLWLLLIPANAVNIYEHLPSKHPEIYACFDGPLLMAVFLVMGIISIGVGGRSDDEDREWWARAGAWVLLTIVVWCVLNALVLYGPHLLLSSVDPTSFSVRPPDPMSLGGKLTKVALFVGSISGVITILFGLSSRTPATVQQVEQAGRLTLAMNFAVKMAAPLFALILVVLLSVLGDILINLLHYLPTIYTQPATSWDPFPALDHFDIIRKSSSFLFLLGFFLTMLLVSYFMSMRININEFSLHSMYRNRLIRAYLGASNSRDAQRFTGFDRNDDLKMSEIWPSKPLQSTAPAKPPLHILNMTWNLVGGKNLAWQNRKAVSFTVSPLHCGNTRYGYRKTELYGGGPDNPISLGTALTVSGAAASPNMGYHSSPAITFLMTLFNARLGWWLGNPKREFYGRSSPRVAVWPMFEEAFGQTDENKRYIYLSDGGHFENLGLYEMVLRRCHYIFVVDASRDPDYKFENLGNAIRTIRVDLGVPIEIGNIFMYPRQVDKPNAYCALGKILYSSVNEPSDGLLVYIKPTIAEGEPTDVYNYAQDRDFPHESTSDQWFSEQQFESYRMLGLHAIEQIFPEGWSKRNDFSDLKDHIEELLKAFKISSTGRRRGIAPGYSARAPRRKRRLRAE